MSVARTSATATVMYDGRVLIAGGKDSAGEPVTNVDIVGLDGTIVSAAPMNIARAGHAAVWLYNGYVLITGGTTRGGGATNTAEMYDPLTDHWTLLPSVMVDPRSGHTATNLLDGRILIAGGSNGTSALNSVEIFSIFDETFSFAGSMDSARQNHAAAALLDGRVLIVGGKNAEGLALSSTQVFNPETNGIDAGPALMEARQDATATTLLDGTVLVAGGRNPQFPRNGAVEVASLDLIDISAGSSRMLPVTMSTPRADHIALLLADNNQVLLVGGETSEGPTASVDVYTPWTSELRATGSLKSARELATAANLATSGQAIVSGGSQLNSSEIYGFATVKTDRADYLPGMPVNITGTGWIPGESVHLSIINNGVTRLSLDIVANSWGNISDNTFAPIGTDLGETFYLTATGSQSQAQSKFTDGTLAVTVTGTGTVTGTPTLSPTNCTSSSGSCSISTTGVVALTATGNYVTSWTGNKVTINSGCAAGQSSCSITPGNGANITMAVAFAPVPTVSSISPATAPFGYSGNITVTGTGLISNVTKIVLGGTQLTTTCSGATSCSATVPAKAVGTYAVGVTNGTAANSGTQNFTITPAATVSLSGLTATYDGSTHPVTVTTVPAGLATSVTYDGSATTPTNAGVYAVVATITDPNYSGSASGTLTINKASATITISNTNQTYDGSAKSVTVTTSPSSLATSVTYDGSPTAPKNAGSYSVLATINDANYNASPASSTLIVAKASANISLSNLVATFDGTAHSATVTTDPAALAVDIKYSGSANAPTGAGNYDVLATVMDPNYSGTTTGTLTINKASATITISNTNQIYDGSAKSVTVTTSPSNVATKVTYDGSATAPSNAGSYSVVAALTDPNYSASAVNDTLVIAKAASTITLNDLNQTFDGNAKPVSVITVPPSLAITITYDGNAAVPRYAGTYAVEVVSNDPNYAGSASGSLTIDKASATLTLSGLNQTYDGSTKPVIASTVPAGLTTSITYDGATGAPTAAGTYAVTASVSDANYAGSTTGTLTIAPAEAIIVLSNLSVTYDGTPKSASVATTPAGLATSITYNGSSSAPINAGTYAIVATVSDPNHSGTASGTFTIGKANQTITFGALGSKGISDAPFAVAPTASSGLPVSISASGSCTVAGLTVTITEVGNCSITAAQSGDSNYSAATPVIQSFTIGGGVPSISWAAPQPIVYGTPIGATQLAASASYGGTPVAGTFDYFPSAGTVLGVGVHTLNVTFHPTDGLYTATNRAVQITVLPATVVVTAPNLSRVYGDPNPTSNPTYGPFVNGESSAVIATQPSCTSSATAGSRVGTYPITCSGATASNYQFTYAPGVLTVTAAPLSVTPNNATRPQGQANPAFTGTITGIRNSDPITATYSTTATTASPVGTYPITATLSDGGSGALGNYVSTLNSGTLTVTNNKPDLVEAVTMLTTNPAAGATIQVSDTVTNIGGSSANASLTRVYLSNNGTTKLTSLGTHDVPTLTASANYGPVTTSVTLPPNYVGTYYVLTCADDVSSVVEANETNNCAVSASFSIQGADLVISSVTAPATAAAGSTLSVVDTTKNQGAASANASVTRFYLSNNGTTKLTALGSRNVPPLVSLANSGPVTTAVSIPSNYVGTYYLIACADDVSSVVEANETNNCTASNSFVVQGADLVVKTLTVPSSGVSGNAFSIVDTTANVGAAPANASVTRYYLSNNGTSKVMTIGSRYVQYFENAGSSGPVTTTVYLPDNIAGTYYLIACADDVASVQESNETNNCTTSSSFVIQGADLVAEVTGPIAATAGTVFSVTDRTFNQGQAPAGLSTTRFYLSSNGVNKLTVLGGHSVISLPGGATAATTSTLLTMPSGSKGTYYMVACTDDTYSVAESNETNNCSASAPFSVK